MNIKTFLAATLIGVSSFALSGCPTAPGTYAIWLVNASTAFTVTNIKVADSVYEENVNEFPDDIPPNTTHIIDNVLVGDLDGRTVRVEVTGDNGGDVFNLGDDEITLPDPVAGGDVYVIVVRGNNSLDFSTDYVPLDESSKGRLLTKGLLPPIQ